MDISTDEFFASYPATKKLVKDLETIMSVFSDRLSKDERRGLMGTNLIMIRNCLQDFGIEGKEKDADEKTKDS